MSMIQGMVFAGALLFTVGIIMVLTRRNALMALIGVELILNAANLNFVAFSRLHSGDPAGQMAALFIIVLAAAEIATGLAIIIHVFRKYKTINLDEIDQLKG